MHRARWSRTILRIVMDTVTITGIGTTGAGTITTTITDMATGITITTDMTGTAVKED